MGALQNTPGRESPGAPQKIARRIDFRENPQKSQSKMKSNQFQVSEQEHKELLRLTKEHGLTLKEYIRRMVSTPSENLVIARIVIIQRMPEYYNAVNQIKNKDIQEHLEDFGGFLCQSLK